MRAYTAEVKSFALACVALLAGCGKELNPEFCAAYPADERCGGTPGIDAEVDGDGQPVGPDAFVPTCPASYTETIPGSVSRYRVVTTGAAWLDAQADCADDGDGTHLLVVSTDIELQGLAPFTPQERWLGHSDRAADGTWLSVTDENGLAGIEATTSPPWAAGEPDGSGSCALILADLRLRDRDCIAVQGFLCECDGQPVNNSNF